MWKATSVIGILVVLMAPSMVYGKQNPSIVIVPGILGNQLEAKLDKTSGPHFFCPRHRDWYTLWLGILELIPEYVDCFADNIKLQYNSSTGKYHDQPGVQTRVPDFDTGGTDSIEYLDPDTKFLGVTNYFHDMVERFVNDHGYVRGKTILGAPYDWRYAPDDYLEQGYYSGLKTLVEKGYTSGNNTPVVMIAHSMGAPTSLYFLTKFVDQAWKDKYLKAYVTISGVWRGAAKSAKAFASGDNEGIIIDRDIWARASQRTYPSTAWLLPYPSADTWTKDDILVITAEREYSAWDYKQYFEDMKYPRGYDMFERFRNLTGELPPPNVDTYCFYGMNKSTPLQFKYGKGEFPDTDPDTVYGNGDGTVNVQSLEACHRWKDQQKYSMTWRAFPGVEHVETIKDDAVIKAVEAVVFS